MKGEAEILTRRERNSQLLALGTLLFLGGMALAGPGGERDQLKNRVDLLDPDHADPDLSGELVRDKLNVIHPDEVVILLNEPDR
jgi:hypothetical protein